MTESFLRCLTPRLCMLNIARTSCTSGKSKRKSLLIAQTTWYHLSCLTHRWNEGKTVHVQLTGRAHRTYRAKVEDIISRSKARVAWLKKGSRQLFGTLLESRVVIVIDTSSSVKERLSLIKTKVEELLQVREKENDSSSPTLCSP